MAWEDAPLMDCMETISASLETSIPLLTRIFMKRGKEASLYLHYFFPRVTELKTDELCLLELFKAVLRSIMKPRRGKQERKSRPFTSLAETVEITVACIEKRCMEIASNFTDQRLVEAIWTLELVARFRPVSIEVDFTGPDDVTVAYLHVARHQGTSYTELLVRNGFLDRSPSVAAATFKYLTFKPPADSSILRQCLSAPWLTEDMASEAAVLLGAEAVLALLRTRGFVLPLESVASELRDLLCPSDITLIVQSENCLKILFRILCSGQIANQLAVCVWESIQSVELNNPFGSGCVVKLSEYFPVAGELGSLFLSSADEIVQANGLALLANQELVRNTLETSSSDRLIWTAIHACRKHGWIDLIPCIIPAIKEVKPLKEFLGMLADCWPDVTCKSEIVNLSFDDSRLQAILSDFQNQIK